jgi:hypothetical protein
VVAVFISTDRRGRRKIHIYTTPHPSKGERKGREEERGGGGGREREVRW